MTKTGSNATAEPSDKAAPTKKGLGLSPVQVIAGGGAAAVASVIGGHLGLAGTVVGAFILSVVSGIALPLFRASLENGHERIKRVVPRRATAETGATLPPTAVNTASIVRATSSRVSAAALPPVQAGEDAGSARRGPRSSARGRKAWMAIGGTAIIFVIGVGSIVGIQSATGVALSHGTSDLQSGISQVVTTVKDGKGTPPTDPKPAAPTVAPSTVPTDPATEPTEQPAATPTPTGDPAPSAEPTAPAGADNPAPSGTPDPAAGTSVGSGGVDGAGSQVQPGAGASPGDAPAK